jgi:hypothetical protein
MAILPGERKIGVLRIDDAHARVATCQSPGKHNGKPLFAQQ